MSKNLFFKILSLSYTIYTVLLGAKLKDISRKAQTRQQKHALIFYSVLESTQIRLQNKKIKKIEKCV